MLFRKYSHCCAVPVEPELLGRSVPASHAVRAYPPGSKTPTPAVRHPPECPGAAPRRALDRGTRCPEKGRADSSCEVIVELLGGDALECEVIEVAVQEGIESFAAEFRVEVVQEQPALLIGTSLNTQIRIAVAQVDRQHLILRLEVARSARKDCSPSTSSMDARCSPYTAVMMRLCK